MLTADEIINLPIKGNHHADSRILDYCNEFVMAPSSSVQDSAKVLRHVNDKVMGCGTAPEMSDIDLVLTYVLNNNDL